MASSSVPLPVTVMIPLRDGGHHIDRCMASVSPAFQILVLDSGSTDDGPSIASGYPEARVLSVEWEGYGPTKQRGLAHARHPWVLWLDADEEVTPELRAEILSVLSRGSPGMSAYTVPRKTFFLGGWVRRCGWYPDRVTRLFNRERSCLDQKLVHEGIRVLEGEVGHLNGPLLHYSFSTLDEYFGKMLRYAEPGARELMRRGKRGSIGAIIVKPWLTFARSYILRLGFLEGLRGLVLSTGGFFSQFMRQVYLYHLTRGL